jgi:putative sterol carrier protein
MSLEEKIYAKLKQSSLLGSVCLDFGDTKIAVDSGGQPLGDAVEADCTLILERETLQGIIDGSVDAMAAYFSGDIKIVGDMGVAMSLSSLLKQ